jgi:8-oxo-dGTP pyrophosphatase MutT (NUDIX family)
MKQEHSAGVVVYWRDKKADSLLFLILHNAAGHWDFAKGKLEAGETTRDAALRETKEETGLDVTLSEGFEQMISYFYKDRTGQLISKTVVFFVGEAFSQDVLLSREHLYFKWLPFEDALNTLTFTNGKQLLKMAGQFLHPPAAGK